MERKNPEGKTLTKAEGTESTIVNTTIKRETRGEAEVKEKKTEPHDILNCARSKRLRYNDKREREYEMGGKIVPIHQENKTEETASRDNKASHKNEKNKSITVNRNGKWRAKEKSEIIKTKSRRKITRTMSLHTSIYGKPNTRERN